LSALIVPLTYLKEIPGWVWKWTFGFIARKWEILFGAKIKWQIWDVPVYDIKGIDQSAIIFRVSNCTPTEIQNVSLEIELAIGNTHEVVINILPLWVYANRKHMDKIEFTEIPQIRKSNRKTVEFDLPAATDIRVEVLLPFSQGFPLHILKHYRFIHKKLKTKQIERI
jgi:hypothetical protein